MTAFYHRWLLGLSRKFAKLLILLSAQRRRRAHPDRWQIDPQKLSLPPRARAPARLPVRERVIVGHGPHVVRRPIGKWILLQQPQHRRRTLQQTPGQFHEPQVLAKRPKSSEPH